jgi:hydrophobic/amphiphilic exporter-1 (mainly G- bacteria), HAE1 family
MKNLIAWTISNSPGMNVLVTALMAIGCLSLWQMRREVFPQFELEIVSIAVPYPGSTPRDVEEAICQKIEEAIRSVDGIKKVSSVAREGAGYVLAELRSDVKDVQKVMNEIDREVNRIPTFPELAEDPIVQQITFREAAIRLGIVGPSESGLDSELKMREVAETVRDEVLLLKSVSTASLMGSRPFQIDVEISEETLRSYNLSLERVAQLIRTQNIELPGGQLKAEGQEILLRAKNQGRVGEDIERLPLLTQPNGVVLTVGDLANVKDQFEDIAAGGVINGSPAMVVNVERTKAEDLLALVDEVRAYASQKQMPEGYKLVVWGDTSVEVRDRINLLLINGAQGLVLVFFSLTFFLDIRLAFWVALGIPVSLLGAGAVLALGDQTINMLSLFSFLVALGIVVDDAIVVGENVYCHVQMGKSLSQAAIDGTSEVVGSVFASVATTLITFAPMLFVSGVMGKFMAVIPIAVIAILTISLLEAVFVLPAHLAHPHHGFFKFLEIILYPLRPFGLALAGMSVYTIRFLDFFCKRIYLPILAFSLRYPMLPLAISVLMMMVTYGMIRGGVVEKILFPKADHNNLQASIAFPDGTPSGEVVAATARMEQAIRRVSKRLGAKHAQSEGMKPEDIYASDQGTSNGPVRLTYREVGTISNVDNPAGDNGSGGHVGQVFVELYDSAIRINHSDELISMWRSEAGEFPGAERMTFSTVGVGPGGKPIAFKLLAPSAHEDQLLAATEETKKQLATFAGLYDIADDNSPGKWEFQFRVKDNAQSTGVSVAELGQTVRNAYFGAEAMRLQRGRHEVKLMVRYPENERQSLVDFREIRVRTADGTERPITELAEIDLNRGFSEINRVDQLRSITLFADLDETKNNSEKIINQLQSDFLPLLLDKYPQVSVRWEGQREQSNESVGSLMRGFIVALLAMYVLLALQFRSYFQPVLIMLIIPFGMIGAVWGHALLGIPLTLFSTFGLVALAGVVVNDSIVLIDFINTRVTDLRGLDEALLDSGLRRFRPIMLTSVTTIAGLLPLVFEKSLQAQMLIPMAASLAFGLMLSTVLVLILVPIWYSYYFKALCFLKLKGPMIVHSESTAAAS